MEPNSILDSYLEEREKLLRTITGLLENDLEVKAAWLFGSLGRGDGDTLSDIDLWVVVEDEQIGKVIRRPHQITSQIDQPILYLEAPQNAPEGGAYLMTCYDAATAPHIVDWYWQPLSRAFIPGQVRLLFNRAGLVHFSRPIRFSGGPARQDILERPMHFIGFFWIMLMITAKQAYRSPQAEKIELFPLLIDPILKARRYLGLDSGRLPDDLPPHRLPGEKMRLLYLLADQMGGLMAAISARGEEVPDLVVPAAYRYLDLIDGIINDK